jgi:hypothetical protein
MTEAARRIPPETDAAIIGRSVGEPECFAAVFDRYYLEIHGYVARRLGPSPADDLASETPSWSRSPGGTGTTWRTRTPGRGCTG